jgi:hypothetical protein
MAVSTISAGTQCCPHLDYRREDCSCPGFLRITDARVSVLDANLKQIGPEIRLESVNGGASRRINGLWIKIGPETKFSAHTRRDLHREPPSVRVCDVV